MIVYVFLIHFIAMCKSKLNLGPQKVQCNITKCQWYFIVYLIRIFIV